MISSVLKLGNSSPVFSPCQIFFNCLMQYTTLGTPMGDLLFSRMLWEMERKTAQQRRTPGEWYSFCKSRHRVSTAVFISETRSTTWDSELCSAFLFCEDMHRGYNVTGPEAMQWTTEMTPFKTESCVQIDVILLCKKIKSDGAVKNALILSIIHLAK